MRVFLAGGGGLVGLNLVAVLQEQHPDWPLVVVDKDAQAMAAGHRLFPKVEFIHEDVTITTGQRWPAALANSEACVMLQAEIASTDPNAFERNTVRSTEVVLAELRRAGAVRLIQISSSAVQSVSRDPYATAKRRQEDLVRQSCPAALVLQPTLMFGWFDRKHLGWLARFMQKLPVVPIPGSGRFIRQPLYVGDFCRVIVRGLEQPSLSGTYPITGTERISYISLMRQLGNAVGARPWILQLPIPVFVWLLQLWALISPRPAFTTDQLKALTAGDAFDLIDWPGLFGVSPTPLADALRLTFNDPRFSSVLISD